MNLTFEATFKKERIDILSIVDKRSRQILIKSFDNESWMANCSSQKVKAEAVGSISDADDKNWHAHAHTHTHTHTHAHPHTHTPSNTHTHTHTHTHQKPRFLSS